jgi:hypothetical protein
MRTLVRSAALRRLWIGVGLLLGAAYAAMALATLAEALR